MMFKITAALHTQFEVCLHNKGIPEKTHGVYTKWLRDYLDFCNKYNFPQKQKESLPHFLKKLQEKRQTKAQQEQAAHAISLYYEFLDTNDSVLTSNPNTVDFINSVRAELVEAPVNRPFDKLRANGDTLTSTVLPVNGEASAEPPDKKGSASQQTKNGEGASWKAEYGRLAETLQSRRYAPTTSKNYTRWVRKFQAFTRSKAPELLSSTDAGQFLASLTMKRRMRLSTRRQAFDALLFFYKHVLHKEFELIRPSPPFRPDSSPGETNPAHTVSPSQKLRFRTPEPGEVPAEPPEKTGSASQRMKTGRGASWETEYLHLTHEIEIRH